MPHFKAAIDKRPANEAKSITDKVSDWAGLDTNQRKIVTNLYEEHFSSIGTMDEFVADILSFIGKNPDDFKNEIFKTYNNYIFSGENAQVDLAVTRLGFSLTRYSLQTIIEREYYDNFNQDSKAIEDFLNLKSINGKDPLYDDDLSVKGSQSIIWVTWSDTYGDPFDFQLHDTREEIYNALALSPFYISGPIFLFRAERNQITAKSVLFRPTVFDANNYSPFKPVEQTFKLHGFTAPYNDPRILVNGIPLTNTRRPEIVVNGTEVKWSDVYNSKEL